MQVMRLQVDEVRQRLREKRIDLQLTDKALEHALKEAFDPAFGARPLKRYLEKHIVAELSVMILKGSLCTNPTPQRLAQSAVCAFVFPCTSCGSTCNEWM